MDVNYNNVLNVLKKLNTEYFGEIDQQSQLNSIQISISNEPFIYMKESIIENLSHHNEGLHYNKETVVNKDLNDNECKEIEKTFVQQDLCYEYMKKVYDYRMENKNYSSKSIINRFKKVREKNHLNLIVQYMRNEGTKRQQISIINEY
jgi:hypothetical protein